MANISTPDTNKTYGTKKPIPWGMIAMIVIIAIVAVFAAIGAVSVFSGSSDTSGGNQNNQQSGDSQVKDSAWFQTQRSEIASAQADLESKQAGMATVKSGFIKTRCDKYGDPARCERIWQDSSNYTEQNTKVTRAETHVRNLIAGYDKEAKTADVPPYAP
jgi:hypothetical protein